MSDFFVPRSPTQSYSIEQSDSLAPFVLLLLSRYPFLQAGRFTGSQLIRWPCIISIITIIIIFRFVIIQDLLTTMCCVAVTRSFLLKASKYFSSLSIAYCDTSPLDTFLEGKKLVSILVGFVPFLLVSPQYPLLDRKSSWQ